MILKCRRITCSCALTPLDVAVVQLFFHILFVEMCPRSSVTSRLTCAADLRSVEEETKQNVFFLLNLHLNTLTGKQRRY